MDQIEKVKIKIEMLHGVVKESTEELESLQFWLEHWELLPLLTDKHTFLTTLARKSESLKYIVFQNHYHHSAHLAISLDYMPSINRTVIMMNLTTKSYDSFEYPFDAKFWAEEIRCFPSVLDKLERKATSLEKEITPFKRIWQKKKIEELNQYHKRIENITETRSERLEFLNKRYEEALAAENSLNHFLSLIEGLGYTRN